MHLWVTGPGESGEKETTTAQRGGRQLSEGDVLGVEAAAKTGVLTPGLFQGRGETHLAAALCYRV